jgi:hypothetical protein
MSNLILTYSRVDKYLDCPRAYWYMYIRRLQIRKFNWNFFVGHLVHAGLHLAFIKDDDIFNKLDKLYEESVKIERKTTLFSPEEEQTLEEWRIIILGMIYAYCIKYAHFIDTHEHIHNEKELMFFIEVDTEYKYIPFRIHVDNIILSKEFQKLLVHEAKTARQLTDNYVWAVQTKMQPAIYYHLGREIVWFYPEGIVYDILQKPSIRVKKNEQYGEYLDRLETYYHDEPDKHLWMEIINEPAIHKADLINTIKYVYEGINNQQFHKSWRTCGLCDYYKLCFADNEDEHIMMYKHKEGNL